MKQGMKLESFSEILYVLLKHVNYETKMTLTDSEVGLKNEVVGHKYPDLY